jgi:hypothetical protein
MMTSTQCYCLLEIESELFLSITMKRLLYRIKYTFSFLMYSNVAISGISWTKGSEYFNFPHIRTLYLMYLSVPSNLVDRSVLFSLPHYLFLFHHYLHNMVYIWSKKYIKNRARNQYFIPLIIILTINQFLVNRAF